MEYNTPVSFVQNEIRKYKVLSTIHYMKATNLMRVAFFIYSAETYRMYPFFLVIRTQVNKYPCIHKLSISEKIFC